jgi:hypothetical protein
MDLEMRGTLHSIVFYFIYDEIKHDNVKITRKGGAGLQRDNNLAGKIQREWTLELLKKPLLNNSCSQKTDSIKRKSIANEPISGKVLKLKKEVESY